MPLERVYGEFSMRQRENSTLVELGVNGTVVFSKEYLREEAVGMLEMYAAILSTSTGLEMAKEKVEEATGGSILLESLSLNFSRETYVLNASASLLINMSALNTPPSAIPGTLGTAMPLQPSIPPANLTALRLNIEYDWETEVFSGNLLLIVEGDASAIIEDVSSSLINQLFARVPAASILSGWLRDFRIGVHGRFNLILEVPANRLHVSGISLQYREAPSETSAKLIEAISSIPALPRSVAVILEAGSTEYEELTLKLPAGESADKILVSGNTSALSDVTYEVVENPWRIADYKLYEKEVAVSGHKCQLLAATNSTLKDVKAEAGKITVEVEGLSGLTGGLNLAIPKSMLGEAKPEEIEVLVDGEPVECLLIEGDSSVSVLATYLQYGENTIEVKWPAPSAFPTPMMILTASAAAVAAAAIAAIVIIKRRS